MTQRNHQAYYTVRAAQSRHLAERAADPSIAAIHVDLATRYDQLAAQTQRDEMVLAPIARSDGLAGRGRLDRTSS